MLKTLKLVYILNSDIFQNFSQFDQNSFQHILKNFKSGLNTLKQRFYRKTPIFTEFMKLPLLKPILDSLQGVIVKFAIN